MSFESTESRWRSMILPLLLALALLAAAAFWFRHTYVHAAATGRVDRVALFPVHTEYKRGSGMLVGANQTEDAVYVIADVALNDRSSVPLFLKSFHGTLTMEDGSSMEALVIDRNDLSRLFQMFPRLKTAADSLGSQPLLRESSVPPGATGRGYVVMSYNVPEAVWQKRSGADVTLEFYHQDPMLLKLPQ